MTNGETGTPPSAAEISEALERVVGSAIFERSARASAFLRFIVDETLAGRGDRLKGYTIAVEVFARDEDFDSQQDPLVRVEARRLRQRLLEYYNGPGGGDPIRFELPRGQYMPTFHRAAEPDEPAGEPVVAPEPELPVRLLAWSVTPAAVALILVLWVLLGRDSAVEDTASPPPPAPGRAIRLPRMVILPVEALSDDLGELAATLTEELNLSFVDYNVISTASAPGPALAASPLAVLREDLDVGYALAGSARRESGGIRVSFRVLETTSGTQLWTGAFDSGTDAPDAFTESVAQKITMLLSTPFGPIFDRESQLIADKPADELDSFECLVRFFEYVRTLDPNLHRQSVVCSQTATQNDPESDWSWASLGMLYLHEHDFGYDRQPDPDPPLDRALEAARRALDINGSDRLAAASLPSILLGLGDREGFLRAVDRAFTIEPEYPALAMHIGYVLTAYGDWQRGIPAIEHARELSTNPPGWYSAAFAYQDLETGDYAGAVDASLRIDAPRWFGTPLTVAASAALAGRTDLAEREVARLLELYPRFRAEGRARLIAMGFGDVLRDRLTDGLALAGLDLD